MYAESMDERDNGWGKLSDGDTTFLPSHKYTVRNCFPIKKKSSVTKMRRVLVK